MRDVPVHVITQGRVDLVQGQISGPEVIVQGLARKFGQFEVEQSIVAIIELLTFRRNGHESIDEAIARFLLMKVRAGNNVANFDMPAAALAWLFLEAMRIPRNVWPLLFNGVGGRLPIDDEQLDAMLIAIRQQGHITEHTHAGPRDLYEGMKGAGRHGSHYHTDGYWQDEDANGWSAEWPKETRSTIMEQPRLTMNTKATTIVKKATRATSWKTTTAIHAVRLVNSSWSKMKTNTGETTTQTLTKRSFKVQRTCHNRNCNNI